MSVTVMSALFQVSRFMSQPLGNLMYPLVLLLVAGAALGMAWGDWQRARQGHRLVLAMGGLVLLRAVYLFAVIATRIGWMAPDALLPPVERFVDLASVGFVAWAYMLPARRGRLTWDAVFGATLALAVSTCVWFVTLWNQALGDNPLADYNTFWQATVWSVWQISLLLLGMFAVLRNRGYLSSQETGRGTVLAALVLLLVGQVLQLVLPKGMGIPHLPIWERLANLIAYPLIAIAVYQRIVAGLRVYGSELQDISQASLDQIKSLLHLFEATQHMWGSMELSRALDHAVYGLARALEADQCAIAFPLESDSNQMRLAAVYSPLRQGRAERGIFALENQLAIRQAVRRKQNVILEGTDSAQLRALFALLGSSQAGPLLVQPLLADPDRDSIGVIIVGNAQSRRPFTPNDAKLCHVMAEQIVTAIQNTRRYRMAQDKLAEMTAAQNEALRASLQSRGRVQDLSDRLASTEAEMEALRQTRDALELKLVSSRAETDTLTRRLAVLEIDLTRQQEQWSAGSRVLEAGVLLTDMAGSVRATNSTAEALLKRSRNELQGLKLQAISEDAQWREAVTAAIGGQIARLTLQIQGNALLCDMAPLSDPGGGRRETKGLAVVLQALSAATQPAHLEAIAAMVEELRAPMTTIIGYADLLLSEAMGVVGDAQRKFLLRIKSGAERAVQKMQELSGEVGGDSEPGVGPLEQGEHKIPQLRMVYVNKLVQEAVAASSSQIEKKALAVDLDVADDLPAVKGDPDQLQQALSCLVAHACLASSVGGRIQVQVARSSSMGPASGPGTGAVGGNGYVTVSIRDSGGGLSDEAVGQVLDAARPGPGSPGGGEPGAGLVQVKKLVEAQHGVLWVESEHGVGTTFSLALPV